MLSAISKHNLKQNNQSNLLFHKIRLANSLVSAEKLDMADHSLAEKYENMMTNISMQRQKNVFPNGADVLSDWSYIVV